uniref:SLAM family member 8 isoform X2 n=1 Tax=Semicossyphus pulcher TaxID=241346 RepID=UPI0037E7AD92
MVGGRLHCLGCLLKCSAVLLLWVCLYDVEASSCQRVIHKKVGDTVQLSSCSPSEGVTTAIWKYERSMIANKDRKVDEKQFKGRLQLNPTDFSLTVKELIPRDSGEFSFHSEVNNQQRATVTTALRVHESIAKQPVLTGNSTWDPLTNSCTVLLECSVNPDTNVSYKWTVGNQTRNGSRLRYNIREEDGDTKFTCIIYNPVSEMSASHTVKCIKDTQEISTHNNGIGLVVILSVVGGACLLIFLSVIAVWGWKQSKSVDDDHTVYADITEVAIEDGSKPSSVYETIDNRDLPVMPGPQTIYDKIQLSRVAKASVSPYQDIS